MHRVLTEKILCSCLHGLNRWGSWGRTNTSDWTLLNVLCLLHGGGVLVTHTHTVTKSCMYLFSSIPALPKPVPNASHHTGPASGLHQTISNLQFGKDRERWEREGGREKNISCVTILHISCETQKTSLLIHLITAAIPQEIQKTTRPIALKTLPYRFNITTHNTEKSSCI